MSFSLLHKLIAYLIAGLGLYALTLGDDLGLVPLVSIALGFVLSAFCEGERIRRVGWIRAWNAVVVAFFVLQILRGALGASILPLGVEYAAFLQVTRLFNRRGGREHQQIAVLAFLHLIAATVLSTSLSYAFVFLVFVIVSPWMLTLSHLRLEIEGNYRGGGRSSGPVVDRVLASRRVVGAGFLAGTALLTLPIFAITLGFFMLFPRVGLGFLSFGTSSGRQVAGFGSKVELGDFGVIRDDPTVVLRVTVPPRSGRPTRFVPLRMRGTSFDYYDGRRWTRNVPGVTSLRRAGDQYPLVRWAAPSDLSMRVVLDHLAEPVIFLPDDTVAITIPPRFLGVANAGRRVFVAEGLDVRYLDDDELGLSYVAHVSTHGQELGVEELNPDRRRLYTLLPPRVGRIRRLTAALVEGAADDRERADRVLAYLRDSGRFTYSLVLPDTRGRDPLEVFLFEARSGHCEYFSTALAVMLRTVGLPTRNVTGFLGGRYNPYGGYYAIRQGDAHSWVEVYLGDRWVTYDPTPPSRVALGLGDDWLSDARAMLDAMRSSWTRHVVGYDLRAQSHMAETLFGWLRGLRSGSTVSGVSVHGTAGTPRPPGPSWSLPGLALLALIVLGSAWRLRSRRRRLSPRARSRGQREACTVYRELEEALARRGHPRPAWVTPVAHAEGLAGEGFVGAEAVREVTSRYQEARWGAVPLEAAELARLRALISQVRDAA